MLKAHIEVTKEFMEDWGIEPVKRLIFECESEEQADKVGASITEAVTNHKKLLELAKKCTCKGVSI